LEYAFIIIYKPDHTHVVIDALSRLLNIIEPTGVLDQTIDVTLFMLQLVWLEEKGKLSTNGINAWDIDQYS
jgi:hypothetical protein